MRFVLFFGLFRLVYCEDEIPYFDNTCWDNDPLTPCPVSKEANERYISLAMAGGLQAPDGIKADLSCQEAERHHNLGGSNVSKCLEALRWRAKLDIEEARSIHCTKTAALMHTWWDGPLVRVVALFLRSFRATQHPECAKLIVWTPQKGSERSTQTSAALVRQIEQMQGAPVVFQVLNTRLLAKNTIFESFVERTIVPKDWATTKPGDKKEGTAHFSDFFQLFVLQRYGGIYFDADMVLLRDLYPLWGLNFEYQWSFIPEKLNNAVQGLRKGEAKRLIMFGNKLNSPGCCKGWGNTLWHAKVVKTLSQSYALPCTAFDPYWLRMDGHHTGERFKPSLAYPGGAQGDRNWLWRANYNEVKDWYDGAFGIHWHGGAGGPRGGDTNVWEPTIKAGSYIEHWESGHA